MGFCSAGNAVDQCLVALPVIYLAKDTILPDGPRIEYISSDTCRECFDKEKGRSFEVGPGSVKVMGFSPHCCHRMPAQAVMCSYEGEELSPSSRYFRTSKIRWPPPNADIRHEHSSNWFARTSSLQHLHRLACQSSKFATTLTSPHKFQSGLTYESSAASHQSLHSNFSYVS